MKIRYLTLLTTLVFLGFTVSAFAKGKPSDDVVVYTVALTTGVFTFFPAHDPAREVTMDSRGYLRSLDTYQLEIGRPADEDYQVIWDAVIGYCAGPLEGDPTISTMALNFDDWVVGRNGDDGFLYINLKSIRLPSAESPEKEIQIILRLKNETTADYPPTADDPDQTQTFYLDSYVIWGKPLSGMSVKGKNKGWDTCYHSDLESDVDFPIAELEIKYIGVINIE